MIIKIPDQFMGKPIEGAMEKILNGSPSPVTVSPVQVAPPRTNAPNLNGYVYVPSINLYVAKNRDLNGLTWNQATDKIYNQGVNVAGQRAEMPTPFEFMSYLKHISAGPVKGLPESERQEIINDILKVGNYRGNWLNAKFVKRAKGFNNLGIETFSFDASGKATKNIIPLEQCLWQDGWADINSMNNQGLLTKSYGSSYEQGKNAHFWYPRENAVAVFDAGSDRANLSCDGDPDNSYFSLGVRLVVRPKGVPPKI